MIQNKSKLKIYSDHFIYLFRCCLILLLSIFCGTGCGSNKEQIDLEVYVKKVQSRPPTPIEPIPTPVTYSFYAYPKTERRSPFRPIIKQRVLAEPDQNRIKQPLESFPLDSLRMVGTLQEENRIWAIIQAPDGKIHRVAKGDYVGQQYGKIVSITPKEVQIVEIVPVYGGWENRPSNLALSDKKE